MITHHIDEHQLLVSQKNISQAAVVGRGSDGSVTLHMSEAAANTLAAILARYDSVHRAFHDPGTEPTDDYDADLWVHVTVDLLAARALIRNVNPPVAHVPRRDKPAGGRPLEVVADIGEMADELTAVLAATSEATQ